MLNDTKIIYFKNKLLELQVELLQLEESSKYAAETVELDQTRQGRLSRMDALQGQAMSQALNHRRKIELQKISSALLRVESGDYGDCVKCGDQIAIKRLELDPAALLCLSCAAKAEQNKSI